MTELKLDDLTVYKIHTHIEQVEPNGHSMEPIYNSDRRRLS